jgi:uncharacterized protein (TIGR02217 family)
MPFTIVVDTLPIFPTDISFGRPGGPEYLTDVVILESGHEQRNSFWLEPRYSWDVGYAVREFPKIYALIQFFHACRGRAKAFRFRDWADWKSSTSQTKEASTTFNDQSLGAATAGQTQFQLKKTYTAGNYITSREIIKPVGGTVKIGVSGSEVISGWTVNEQTGIITRSTPLVGGEQITWGGEFYLKCRFDTDKISNSFEAWEAGGVEIPVVHLRGQ